MTERSQQRSLAQWVGALAHPDPAILESAEEALAAAGVEALPHLLRCLDGEDERLRLRALSLLSLLADRSATKRIVALLHDPSPRLRQRAAVVLARTPGATTIAALSRLLDRESEVLVRLAAVRSLVRMIQTGHDEALRPVLDRLSNQSEDAKVRLAALTALTWLSVSVDGPSCRDALLTSLSSDPDHEVATRARRMIASPPKARFQSWALERLLTDLGADRLSVWRQAVTLLSRGGGMIVEPVVQAMLSGNRDGEYVRRCALVLKSMSPRQLAKLGPYLDAIQQPVPLRALVDVAAIAGSRALQARLAALIVRLAQSPSSDASNDVRQRAHIGLARAGSRLAADDLRRLLEDRAISLQPELATTVGAIVTRRELPSLARAYRRSRGVTRLALRETILELAKREKIRRTDRSLTLLEPIEFRAMCEILGGLTNGAHRHKPLGGSRIDKPSGALLT
ncbi:MAG: HEAT repeat domain-containing protein [Acidobacteriota bacterium]